MKRYREKGIGVKVPHMLYQLQYLFKFKLSRYPFERMLCTSYNSMKNEIFLQKKNRDGKVEFLLVV